MLRLFHQLKGLKFEYEIISKKYTEILLDKDKIINKFRNIIIGDDRVAIRHKIDDAMKIIENLLPRLAEWDYMIRKKNEIISRYTEILKSKNIETNNNKYSKMEVEIIMKKTEKLKKGKKGKVVFKEEKKVEMNDEIENIEGVDDEVSSEDEDNFNGIVAPIEGKKYIPSMHKEILEKSKYSIDDAIRTSMQQKQPLIRLQGNELPRRRLGSTIVDLTNDLASIIDDKSPQLARSNSTVERVKTAMKRVRSDIQRRVTVLVPDATDIIPDGTGMALFDRKSVRGNKLTPWGGKAYTHTVKVADSVNEALDSLPSSLIEYNFVDKSLEFFNEGIVEHYMLSDSDDSSDHDSEMEYGDIFFPLNQVSFNNNTN